MKRRLFFNRVFAALWLCAALVVSGPRLLGAAEASSPEASSPEATSSRPLVVATLHPLLSDLARQVGGDRVRVIELLSPGEDPHDFRPTSSDMSALKSARVILVSGKGLEHFIDDLRDNLRNGQQLVEAGREVRSLTVDGGDELFVCCPEHSVGSLDPHWWHSVHAMERAAGTVARAFAEADPAWEDGYRRGERDYSKRLDQLHRWVKREVRQIPRKRRVLATAHASFNYFCRDYGFRSLPVQGLNRENEISSAYVAEAVERIRENDVRVIFPEVMSHPRGVEAIVRATGVEVGGELIPDGSAKGVTSYEQMVRHNVKVMVKALGESD